MINGRNNKIYLVCCVDSVYLYNQTNNNMTKKEAFLNSISEQINILQQAYNYNKALPDYIFETLQDISLPASIERNITKEEPVKVNEESGSLEYGENKRLVLKILNDKNKAMLKAEILKKFTEEVVMPEKLALNAVTNALAALNRDHEVKGYKPAGLKFKGLFWTLENWWITDFKTNKVSLPIQYEPYSGKLGIL